MKKAPTPPAWLKEIGKASKERGTDKLTRREINAEVASVRRANDTSRKKKAG